MEDIEFVLLEQINQQQIMDLMNNPKVGKLLPLLQGRFDEDITIAFVKAKQKLWEDHGYGPWAFLIKGEFAGWGGLQHEQGEADFALVLDPKFWGWGRRIFNRVKNEAFMQRNMGSITILLPIGRPNKKAVSRFGFIEEDTLSIDDEVFIRFRLYRPTFKGPQTE